MLCRSQSRTSPVSPLRSWPGGRLQLEDDPVFTFLAPRIDQFRVVEIVNLNLPRTPVCDCAITCHDALLLIQICEIGLQLRASQIPKVVFRTTRSKLPMICVMVMNPYPQAVSGLRKGMRGGIKRSTNNGMSVDRQKPDIAVNEGCFITPR